MSSPRSTHCSFHCSLVFTPPSPPRRDEIIGRRKLIDPIRWTERNGTDFRTDIAWTTIRVSRTRSTRVPFNWTRERQVAIIATDRVSILAERREKPNSPRVILIGPPLLPLAPILLERHKLREARSRFHHPLLPRRFSFDVSPNGIPLRTSARTCKHLAVFLRDYAAARETAARFKAGKNIPLRGQEILLDRC